MAYLEDLVGIDKKKPSNKASIREITSNSSELCALYLMTIFSFWKLGLKLGLVYELELTD